MACYRVTFQNRQVFDIDVDAVPLVEERTTAAYVGIIYRVIEGRREAVPLRRLDRDPIQIYAVSERAALLIACEILELVTGTRISTLGGCSDGER